MKWLQSQGNAARRAGRYRDINVEYEHVSSPANYYCLNWETMVLCCAIADAVKLRKSSGSKHTSQDHRCSCFTRLSIRFVAKPQVSLVVCKTFSKMLARCRFSRLFSLNRLALSYLAFCAFCLSKKVTDIVWLHSVCVNCYCFSLAILIDLIDATSWQRTRLLLWDWE